MSEPLPESPTSLPDYPMSLARDRFGVWLHVTGLSLREVVQALAQYFAGHALLVYEPQQLTYATSARIDEERQAGISREDLFATVARLDEQAFWNRVEPLFENASCAVWPAACLDEMIVVQGRAGGAFGLCPVPADLVPALPDDFVYEHPSNVAAKLAFLSVDDTATSVYATDPEALVPLLQAVVAKALEPPPGDTGGIEEVARGLMGHLEEDGVDLRAEPRQTADQAHRTATAALGLWGLGSQWPLLWKRVPVCRVAWDGRRWGLGEVDYVPGRRFVRPVRLVGELVQWTMRGLSHALVFGLPLAVAAMIWAASGPVAGLLALLVALVLWPRFVLGVNWRELRRRRAQEEADRKKYGL
ncbi:MAG: hypothetical protein ACLF0G_12525 [Candidatus Brocadiia bacterium]